MKTFQVIYRFHAIRRMFERNITEIEVVQTLHTGNIIEDYPADQPYPSYLVLAFISGRPLHVVVAQAEDIHQTIVITVYEPDLEIWEPGFEVRRKL